MYHVIWVFVFTFTLVAACSPAPTVPSTTTAGQHAGPAAIYPDPSLTPSAVFPDVTAAQVCTRGYTRGVRNVTAEEKAAVYAEYQETDTPDSYEVDHFIPLELGGSNAIANLWPEPAQGAINSHAKDKVENYLHDQVCNGRITLAAAQGAIRSDWYEVYLQITNR